MSNPGMDNHVPSNTPDEIAYPFPNFNVANVEVGERASYSISIFIMYAITYPLRLIHVSKRGLSFTAHFILPSTYSGPVAHI